ncbi:MAG: alpha/beta hydrolase [Anaerolineae bacterium]
MPTVRANNINLYYESTGHGQPLLLIHGLGSSTRDWEFQVSELSKSYQVVTFDLRGHGQSDKPEGPYTIPLFSADAAGLLQALGIESAHVLGVSLGGGVAFQLALDHPTLVKTLTIVNSGPSMGGTPEQIRQEMARRVGVVKSMGMRAMGQALAQNLLPKPEHAMLRETFIERWAQNDPRAYIDATLSLGDFDVLDRLGEIRRPVLVISADQDYTSVAAKEAYVKRLSDARLVVIADARHALPTERPEEFNAALLKFLAEHS